MLLVIASREDRSANELVVLWNAWGATLLACEDLCHHGWRFDPSYPDRGRLVAGGSVFPVSEVTGVLTRRPHVFEVELMQVAVEDRPFVAAEINAFLLAWLSSLRCPVINRPSGTCLSGPAWRAEQWVWVAASLGMIVNPARRNVEMDVNNAPAHEELKEVSEVIVVGERWFGLVDSKLGAQAVQLARAAEADLLSVRFQRGTFAGASALPVLEGESVIAAVLEHLEASRS